MVDELNVLKATLASADDHTAQIDALHKLVDYWHSREPLQMEQGDKSELLATHLQLSTAYKAAGDYAKALENYEAYHALYTEIAAAESAGRLRVVGERVTALQSLLSGMYHDLMTPISIIKTSLYLIGKMKNDEQKASERRQLIQKAVDDLIGKIKKMTLLAKLDSYMPGIFNPCEGVIEELIETALNMLHPERDARTRVMINNKSPGAELVADATLLPTALAEVLDNALRYSDAQARVHLKIAQVDNRLIIEIKDKGAGIVADDLPTLFESFYRKAGQQASDTGHGLGLPIAQAIIEKHGGYIQVESVVGEGSTFRVEIPTQHATVEEAAKIDFTPT